MTRCYIFMSEAEIWKKINSHQRYIFPRAEDIEVNENLRADFSNVEFPVGFDFNRADLRYAIFTNARLIGADFSHCMLKSAVFDDAIIEDANFSKAALEGASFKHTVAGHTDFSRADMLGADLSYSDFTNAIFADSSLACVMARGVTLRDADLSGVNLNRATIESTDFRHSAWDNCLSEYANTLPDITSRCPEVGSFIGFKKIRCNDKYYIATLMIPGCAKRVSGIGSNKCRCNRAIVTKIEEMNGAPVCNVENLIFHSLYTTEFIYKLGETVTEPIFDSDPRKTCASGIHFFLNKKDAVRFAFC